MHFNTTKWANARLEKRRKKPYCENFVPATLKQIWTLLQTSSISHFRKLITDKTDIQDAASKVNQESDA